MLQKNMNRKRAAWKSVSEKSAPGQSTSGQSTPRQTPPSKAAPQAPHSAELTCAIREAAERLTAGQIDPARLEQTVRAAKSAYFEAESAGTLTRFEFLMAQSRYIRKRWWAAQGLLLAAAGWLITNAGSSIYASRGLGLAGPMFVILILPELWKNQNSGSTEIEGAAYYSLRQIYAARLTLFAMADLLLLTAFCGVAVIAAGISPADLAAQFLLPFTVTCCICFHTLYNRRLRSEGIAIALSGCWCFIWTELVLGSRFYDRITAPVWCGLLALSAAYLTFCVARGQEHLHRSLEAELIWN